MATVQHIFISSKKRGPVNEVESANLEAGKGIIGDRYHSLAQQHFDQKLAVPDNHVSIIAKEELDKFLADNSSDLQYGDFRRSIVTSGIDLNALVGKQFKVGDAVCYGAELCEPCAFLASSVHPAVLPGLVNRGGLRATVITTGTIAKGSHLIEI
jgi:MOSC domain-containing protein YiiM